MLISTVIEGMETITEDPAEFLAAVDALEPTDACCCVQEPVWHALQVAVRHTPEYSDIYIFTDAGGNDAKIMHSVMSQAESKNVKVGY